jgi:hypothetical protein
MAAQKLPNCCVGVCAYLRCFLRHCFVPGVRRIPRELRSLHPGFFSFAIFLMTFLGIITTDFLADFPGVNRGQS